MKLVWVWSGGTVNLDGDYRTCTFTSSVDVVDGTAGADANKVKYMGMKDATANVSLVAQTGGTAMNAALVAGNVGTLTIQPEGTATGKPKITFPSFSTGASYEYPYNDVALLSCGFEANAAYTVGSN
jgi:hypothetical protein